MPTLFEMMMDKFKKKECVSHRYYNPYKIKVGSFFKIDHLDYEELNFEVVAFREVKRILPDDDRFMCDYDLFARDVKGDEILLRLRLVPIENPDGEMDHHAILLKRVEEFGYDKDFHESLAEPWENPDTGENEYTLFLNVVDNDGNVVEEEGCLVQDQFWRVNDVTAEWEAETAFVRDKDNDGTIEESEVDRHKMWYWDYWRQTVLDGVEVMEFYIIEMDNESGYFELWRGTQIDPARIMIS